MSGGCLADRLMNAVKSEDTRGVGASGAVGCAELQRVCRCAAYNALAAVISRTQTELKFYNGFLFSDNPAKVIEHRELCI